MTIEEKIKIAEEQLQEALEQKKAAEVAAAKEEAHRIRKRNSDAVKDVIEQSKMNLPIPQKRYLPGVHVPQSMPGSGGYVRPQDRVYPEHEQIREWMMDLVAGNIEVSEGHQHMREVLDDIISDLHTFRNALATPEQYHEKGLL
jgi:hypothetical protein